MHKLLNCQSTTACNCSPGDAGGDRELSFGNIEIVPDKGEEKQNVAEMVVARGFAQVCGRGAILAACHESVNI